MRSCLVHLPPQFEHLPLLPAVITYHGSRGSGRVVAGETGFNALADEKNFIVAYPDGATGPGTWNCLFGKAPVRLGARLEYDDVAFTRVLIDLLCQSFHADPDRVFVSGLSAGGYMCYRLAMEMPDRIAAAGVVVGSVGIRSVNGKPVTLEIPKPSGPILLIHICGKKDCGVPFKGGQSPKNKWPSVFDDIQLFVAGDGCSSSPIKEDDRRKGVHKTLYSGCRAGTEVELVILDKCGHEWPEERHGLSATRALWDFFAAHPRIKESR